MVTAVVTVVLLASGASYAAQKRIEWFDDLQCSSSIKFDAGKYDARRLQNTIDVIFTGRAFPEVSPDIPIQAKSPVDQQVEVLRQHCEDAIHQGAELPIIDLPGIEAYRTLKLEELADACKFSEIKISAAYGDAAVLRTYTPSVAKCSPFIDALGGKTDIIAVWRDLVKSHCPDATASSCLYAREGTADEMDRIRYDVLMFGWNNCSTPFRKSSEIKRSEKMRNALEQQFELRFKVKRSPCSD